MPHWCCQKGSPRPWVVTPNPRASRHYSSEHGAAHTQNMQGSGAAPLGVGVHLSEGEACPAPTAGGRPHSLVFGREPQVSGHCGLGLGLPPAGEKLRHNKNSVSGTSTPGKAGGH